MPYVIKNCLVLLRNFVNKPVALIASTLTCGCLH